MNLCFEPAHQLLEKLTSGQTSSTELVAAMIERITAFDTKINALVVRDFEGARQRAALADEARSKGVSWGPLHGLPITVKESFDWAGTPTTWGIPAYAQNIASQSASAVQRLVDAGALVLGKTNVPVALSDWQTFNPIYGTTCNPWNPDLVPGGSSGGSAAALAAGFCALELGSDIGASIRNPAHYCGVYGHKPTWGVVPMRGHQLPGVTCIDSMDIAVAGPLARSARDLQLALEVLTSPLALFGAHGWRPTHWNPIVRTPRQCRVAILYDDAQAHVDDSIQNRMKELAQFLRHEGVAVREDIRPVDSAQSHRVYIHLLRAATGAAMDATSYAHMQTLARNSDPQRDTIRERTWRASTCSHRDWILMDQQRAELRQQWDLFFEDFDLLITPVATSAAFPHNQVGERWDRMIAVNGHAQASTDALFWAGYPGVTGLPATAIPMGLTDQGLPIGAQVIGNHFSDPLCLQMAAWLEQAWCGFTPPPHLQ